MSEPPPPAHPVDYPYKARFDHDSKGQAGLLSLRKGDEGKVLAQSGNNILVTLPRLGLEMSGWVPKVAIDIGTTRRTGDIAYSTDLPKVIDAGDIESFYVPQRHLFGKTTAAYMIGMKNAQEELPMLASWVAPFIDNEASCTKTVECIVAGTAKAELLESFNYSGLTINNLVTRGSHITKETKAQFAFSLIYVIVMTFVAPREPEVYVGKTNDGAQRYEGHMRSKTDGTTAKDAAHRESSEMHMIPICILDGDADDDHLRLIAEQYFVNIFGSYFKKVLVFRDDEELSTFVRVSGASGQDFQTTAEERVYFISRWYNDCMHAYLFNKFAASVFEKVGWTPLCQRPRFGAPKGSNWQSPLGGHYGDKTIWTAIDSTELGVTNYTHEARPATLPHRGSISILSLHGPRGMEHFRLNIAENEPGPSVGDNVIVCFEIMHGSKPHPTPWARLPQICRFPDVDLANSLGVRINWTDKNGEDWEKYVQSRGAAISRDDDISGSLANYGSATGIIRFLQRQKLTNEEGFDSDLGLASVKEVKYIHLKQLIDIRDRDFGTEHGMINEVTKPTMYSLREVGDMLYRLGADNIDGDWQVFKEGTGKEEGRRSACDSCFVLKTGYYTQTALNANQCERVSTAEGEPPTCKRCKALGRPCSWSVITKLGPDTKLFKALCPLPYDSNAIVEAEDPVLRGIDAATAEEERDQVPAPKDEPAPSAGRARGRGRGSRGGGRGSRGGRGGVRGGAKKYETMAQRGARLMAETGMGGTVEAIGEVSD